MLGYKLRPSDIGSPESKILTYHRTIEAFKFAYAKRTALGDEEFVDVKEVILRNLSKILRNLSKILRNFSKILRNLSEILRNLSKDFEKLYWDSEK